MPQAWKTIPLFISSTFRDMHAERDVLNEVVFPALAEKLKARRCRLEPIDLRVGVETDSTRSERERELQILKVCLAEIERSRPFLLVLLGDRYGWVPGPDRISAAAGEAGYAPEDENSSVTALEIEYGLLKKDPVQRRRCLLCLREPLPYDCMPQAASYSDAHATDEGAPERAEKLSRLKAKILADPALADHRLPYRLDWNTTRQQPETEGENGIAAWGRQVEAALWALLDRETAQFAATAEPTWQEEERFAIEELVERLKRGFVGRQNLVSEALGVVTSADTAISEWGLCFTGETGSGKSALFARLHRALTLLQHTPQAKAAGGVMLLTHVAGISPRAGQTEWMLRRWIGELGMALDETPVVPDDIKPEDLEHLFAQLLTQVASQKRVVVLVDALNQFLRTERARTVSWLPALWPANARFIATAIPGEETGHLSRRTGVALVNVPPLRIDEAEAVAAQVYGRYHRQVNAEVLGELLALRRPDGTPAAGNPLWLSLALDLLNQLDADDFTAAEAAAGGSAEEKLRGLVRARARTLPPEVEGLYGRLLTRVEKVAGVEETRGFAALIALSRHGWREEDLQHLLPQAADLLDAGKAHQWDALRFAILRRCFRAHLVRRGALEQWDCAHATLRQAILSLLAGECQSGHAGDLTRALYACGADYLESLPPDSSIRAGDLLWQMLGTRDALRAALYYVANTSESRLLALFLTEDEAVAGHPLRQFVLALLGVGVNELRAAVANKFIFDLHDALAIEGHLRERKELLEAARATLTGLTVHDPGNTGWLRNLSVSHEKLGDLLFAQGELAGALAAYRAGMAIRERLACSDPEDSDLQHDLNVSHSKMGDVLSAQGDLTGALAAYRAGMAITECLTDADPINTGWQRDLSINHDKLGDVLRVQGNLAGALAAYRAGMEICERLAESDPGNAEWQRDLGLTHLNVGDMLRAQGDLAGALAAYRAGMTICERLADSDPCNAEWQRDFGLSHNRLGDVLRAQGNQAGALAAYQAGMAITKRLADSDPSNARWQSDLGFSHTRLGDGLRTQGDLTRALAAYRVGLAIRERLAESDPGNAEWQRDLSVSHLILGDVLTAQGDLTGALAAFRVCHAITERLADSDSSNAQWQRDLSISCSRLGDMLRAPGDLAGALAAYRTGMTITERLARSDPGNKVWQRDLAASHHRLGNLLSAQGDLAGARGEYQAALDISERLAESDPGNQEWQSDLSLSHSKLGEILSAQGVPTGALREYRISLSIEERLAQSDPGNADWQRNLSVSHGKLGEILSAQGDLAGALAAYRAGMAITERLAAFEPNNAGLQRDLSVSHYKLAVIARQFDDDATIEIEFGKCFAILEGMKQRGLHFDPHMARVYQQLAPFFGKQ